VSSFPRRRSGSPRILVVDDEPGVRHSLQRLLEWEAYEVESAGSGEEALAVLRHSQCDSIVCDLRMPGMSGQQLHARILIEFPELAGRMIFTSGDLYDHAAQAFLEATGCPALQKPYQTEAFLILLARLTAPAAEPSAVENRRAS
jgi:CheY-like chemotaxis protein